VNDFFLRFSSDWPHNSLSSREKVEKLFFWKVDWGEEGGGNKGKEERKKRTDGIV